jgi:methionyl-tRNA formyltransferase
MRILYFGTSAFAVPAFKALLESRHEVVGVVTQPDRPSGRGLTLSLSAVKKAAIELAPHLPILQPEKARTKAFRLEAEALNADAFVVASFGQILSQRLLDGPKYGGINIHGSLLPRWRGAAPIQYCLVAGDSETGVSTMQMDAGMDSGDILLQAGTKIESDDTIESLEIRLSALGADLVLETLDKLEAGTCLRTVQDPNMVAYCPSLPPTFGYFDLSKSAVDLYNLSRGVTPRPGAFIAWNGKRIKICKSEPILLGNSTGNSPIASFGEIVEVGEKGIIVKTGFGSCLLLIELQPDSRAKMNAAEWARGARATVGQKFESLFSAE